MLALMLVLAVPACQTERTRPERPRPLALDECAERLHKLERHLLKYYWQHDGLPESLDQLQRASGVGELPPLVCPISGEPYLYRPEGAGLTGRSGQVLMCDATPAHSGRRWSIVVTTSGSKGPMVLNVIALPPAWQPAGEEKASPDEG